MYMEQFDEVFKLLIGIYFNLSFAGLFIPQVTSVQNMESHMAKNQFKTVLSF